MNAITLLHPGIKQRADWRTGFMVAIERRLNLDAPPSMGEAEIERRCTESSSFAKGFKAGMDCALSCSSYSVPEEYEGMDQYDKAGWLIGALCLVAVGILFFMSNV